MANLSKRTHYNWLWRACAAIAFIAGTSVSPAVAANVATWTNASLNFNGSVNAATGTGVLSRGSGVTYSNIANTYTSSQYLATESALPTLGNKYYQVTVNTTGFSNIVLNFTHLASHGSLANAKVYYSTTGSGGTYTLAPNGTLTISTSAAAQTVNMSSVPGLNNNPNVAFRIHCWGAVTLARTYSLSDLSVTGDAAAPYLEFNSYTVSGGNGDQFFDPNECNGLSVTVNNTGNAAATGVSAVLSASTTGVFVTQNASAYPNIGIGSSGTNSTQFLVSTGSSYYCGAPISFVLTVTTSQGSFILPFQTTLPATANTRFDNNTVTPIPDAPKSGQPGIVDVPVAVSGLVGTVLKVNVLLHVTHPKLSNLRIALIAPDGTSVLLVNKQGGNNANFGNFCSPDSQRTTFDDDALVPIAAGTAPFAGSYRPQQPLSLLRGKLASAMNGTWRLRVSDMKKADVGQVQCWSLVLTTSPCAPAGGSCVPSPTADVSVTKSGLPAGILNLQNITYTLVVHNSGPDAASSVVLTDPLPAEVDFVGATTTQGSFVESGGFVTFNLGSLLAGASATCTITVTANTAGTVINTASVEASEVDTNLGNNSATAVNTVGPVAELQVFQSDSPDPVVTGNNVTYTVGVTNNGPDAASSLSLIDTLPAGAAFISAVASTGNCSQSGGIVTCTLGDLDAAEFTTVTVVVTPAACGTSTNTVTASATEADSNPFNNTNIAESTTVNDAAPGISIGAPSGTLTNTGPVSFTVTYTGASAVTLAPGNVSLNQTGTANGTVSVTGSGTASRTVTISSITGNGTLGISISSGSASACGGALAPAAGPSTTFSVDNAAPTVSSIVRADANPTKASTVNFTVTFSEPVTGVAANNFTVVGSGVTGIVGVITGSGTTWNVPVVSVSGDGTVRLDLDQNLSSIEDGASNALAGAFTTGESYDIDQTAPTVVSIVRADSNPTNATTVNFTVTFSESVTGVAANNFTVVGSGVTGSIGTVTGSGTTWNVPVGSVSGNGTVRVDLDQNLSNIVDSVSNALAAAFASGESYDIDQTAPTVVSIVRADSNPTNATTVNFTVTFSESVAGVDASNFTVAGSGVTGTVGTVTGSGTTWNVPVGSVSGDGTIRVDFDQNLSGIEDDASNALAAGFTAGESYDVDQTAPTVASIVRADANPTNALTVNFTVTFSEPVTGVDWTNFTVVGSGVTGIVGVVTGSGTIWNVPVVSVSGDGTVRVDLDQNLSNVEDGVSNALAAAFTSGESYDIDQTAPTVVSIVRADSNPTNATTVNFTVTFSEAVTGVDAANFTVAGSGVTATVGAVTGSGTTWNVPVGSVSGDGTIRVDLDQNLSGIEDDASNALSAAFTTGEAYDIDQTAPTVVSIVRADANPTNATTVNFTVTFSEPVTGVDAVNFTVAGSGVTGTVGTVTGSGTTWNVPVGSVSGDGTIRVDLDQNLSGIEDNASNAPSAAFTTGEAYDIDQTAPTVVSIVRADSNPTNALTVNFTVTFSEPVTGVDWTNFTVVGSSVTGIVSVVTGSGTTWNVPVVSVSGDGTVRLDLDQDLSSIEDGASNALAVAFTTGESYDIDQTAPTVVSIVRADSNPTNATTVNFTVTFSEAVTGVDASNFTVAGSGVTGTVGTVTGSGTTWNVPLGSVSGDGTIRMDLDQNLSGIEDDASNALSAAFTTGEAYDIDQTAPTVVSIVRADSNPTNATTVDFTVTFSESVTGVNGAKFSVVGSGVTGTVGTVTGSGSTWNVPVNSVSGDGTIRVNLDQDMLNIVDGVSNALAAAFTTGEAYDIDQTAPTVVSIVRADSNPTNATTVNFTVTFSEPVTGVAGNNFTVVGSGVTGTVGTVTGSGTTWNVPVGSVSGDGTIRVELDQNLSNIEDGVSNALSAAFTTGESYDVDQSTPTVISIVRADSNPTSATTVRFLVVFSEDVTGVADSNFTVAAAGFSTGTIGVVSGSGSTWAVDVTSVGGDGMIGIDFDQALSSVADAAGNGAAAAFTSGEVYTIDQTSPVVALVAYFDDTNVDVTFADTSAMGWGVLDPSLYTYTGSGLASNPDSVSHVSGNTYRLTWSSGGIPQNTSFTITVADGPAGVQDAAGNPMGSPNSGVGQSPSGVSNWMAY